VELNVCPSCDAFTGKEWESCPSCGHGLAVSPYAAEETVAGTDPIAEEAAPVLAHASVAAAEGLSGETEHVEESTPTEAFAAIDSGPPPGPVEPESTFADWTVAAEGPGVPLETGGSASSGNQLDQVIGGLHLPEWLDNDETSDPFEPDAPGVPEYVGAAFAEAPDVEPADTDESHLEVDEAEFNLPGSGSLPLWSSYYANSGAGKSRNPLASLPLPVLVGGGVLLLVLVCAAILGIAFTGGKQAQQPVEIALPVGGQAPPPPTAPPTSVPDGWTQYIDHKSRFTVDFPSQQKGVEVKGVTALTGDLPDRQTEVSITATDLPPGDYSRNDQLLRSTLATLADKSGMAVKSSLISTNGGAREMNAHFVAQDRSSVADVRIFVRNNTLFGLVVESKNPNGDPQTFGRLTDSFKATKKG